MKNKLLLGINLIAVVCCVSITIKFIAMPVIAKTMLADNYKELMFQCDNVMRDHMIAKNRVIHDKTDESIKDLEAAEMGLISCHEYDKYRKKMLSWGLSHDDLALIGLEAIEAKQEDLMMYVETHEFKY